MNDTSFFTRGQADVPAPPAAGKDDPLLFRHGKGGLDSIGLPHFATLATRLSGRKDKDGEGIQPGSWLRRGVLVMGLLAAVLITWLIARALPGPVPATPVVTQADIYRVPRALRPSDVVSEQDGAPAAPARVAENVLRPRASGGAAAVVSVHRGSLPREVTSMTAHNQMVTASVLKCRTAPSTGASIIMKFLRGAVVVTSERQGEWSHVTRRGHGCWVKSDLLQD